MSSSLHSYHTLPSSHSLSCHTLVSNPSTPVLGPSSFSLPLQTPLNLRASCILLLLPNQSSQERAEGSLQGNGMVKDSSRMARLREILFNRNHWILNYLKGCTSTVLWWIPNTYLVYQSTAKQTLYRQFFINWNIWKKVHRWFTDQKDNVIIKNNAWKLYF